MKKAIKFIGVALSFLSLAACGGKSGGMDEVTLLSSTMLDVKMGQTAALEVYNYDGEIKWTSSDSSIALVDEDGKIKPISIGSVAITASLASGENLNCIVDVIAGESNVEKIYVTSYYSNADDITLNYNDSETVRLKADCSPVDPIEKLTWSSSDERIATVSQDGVVTARGNGIVNINATALNGVTGSCKVRVKNVPAEIENENKSPQGPIVEISKGQTGLTSTVPVPSPNAQSGIIISEQRVYLSVAEYVKLNYAVSNTSNTQVTWLSTDKAVAVVKDGYIVGVGEGRAVISAVTHDGAVASCSVAVGKAAIEELKKEIPGN